MPTAAKLAAAVMFAALGWIAADMYKLGVPERTVWGYFNAICAAIGLLCGWFVMGSLVGQGYRAAIGYGLRTAVTLVFWVMVALCTYLMVLRSMSLRYDGPMEAVVGIFDLMIENGQPLGTLPVILTLLLGGTLGGMLTEWVGRRWK